VPTYQYACTACDERPEAVQSFTDAPLTECPACGSALRKVFSAVGVVFKGSGFYKNDSRDAPKKDATKKDAGKTDSTPVATPVSASSSDSSGGASSTPATPAPAAKTSTSTSSPASKSA